MRNPRYVPLRAPDWSFDRDELRAAFNKKTKAIIVCNPNNPTGKVFTRDEMEFIAGLCQEFDALASRTRFTNTFSTRAKALTSNTSRWPNSTA